MEKQQGIKKDDDDKGKTADYGEAGAIAEEMLSAIHTVTSYGGQPVVVDRYVDRYCRADHMICYTCHYWQIC